MVQVPLMLEGGHSVNLLQVSNILQDTREHFRTMYGCVLSQASSFQINAVECFGESMDQGDGPLKLLGSGSSNPSSCLSPVM